MRILDFIFGVVDRFAPMDQETKAQLKLDALSSYNKARDLAFRKKVNNDQVDADATIPIEEKPILKEKVKLLDRLMIYSESWWFRTLLAIGFIVVVPKIKDYWAGSNKSPEDLIDEEDEDDEDDDY